MHVTARDYCFCDFQEWCLLQTDLSIVPKSPEIEACFRCWENGSGSKRTSGKTAKKVADTWPKALSDQVRAVAELLVSERRVLGPDDVAKHFSGKGPWKKRLPKLLETLESVGRARKVKGGWVAVS